MIAQLIKYYNKIISFIYNKLWIGDELKNLETRYKMIVNEVQTILKDGQNLQDMINDYRRCTFKDAVIPDSDNFLFWVKDLKGRYIFTSKKFNKIVLSDVLNPIGLNDEQIREYLQDDNLLQEIKESELDTDYIVQSWVTKDKTLRLLVLRIKDLKDHTIGFIGFGEELTELLASLVDVNTNSLVSNLSRKE